MNMLDFDAVVEQYHQAVDEIVKGSADDFRRAYSRRDDITPYSLRVTTIFRPEEGTWKVVHRHADPITTARPAESVIQQ